MQYLGFYSQLNVPWPTGLMSLFKGFSFFNLSLEAIHLTCGGLAYTDIWMLQMVLPLFYPAAALVNIAADLLLAAAKPKWLMGLGWRPQRDFTLKAHTIDREIVSYHALWYTTRTLHGPAGRLFRLSNLPICLSVSICLSIYLPIPIYLAQGAA